MNDQDIKQRIATLEALRIVALEKDHQADAYRYSAEIYRLTGQESKAEKAEELARRVE